ncbi:MAG: hypothetical protein G01um101413_577 [Parcubacteria group bacterium Gr01-1014_13]|nr:MAG: hypothetical protein G01um101413_577 [Parcubacteria group bacterium Gr01-1014_13]
MFKLKEILKFGALSLALSLVIIFSAQAQTATDTSSGSTTQTHDEQCLSGGGKLCKNSDGSNWCSYSTSPCPAYDTASCSSQGGEWCNYAGTTNGYCASTPGSCPINDEAGCTAKSRPWCKYSTGGSGYGGGWCAEVGYKCPAYDEPSCVAQGSEWCTSSYGSGWCSTTPGSCPVNDKATCESKSRTWCVDSSSYSTSGGWCANTGSTCPSSSTSTTPTPTPVYPISSWPNTESDCTKYKGVWCVNTYTSGYGTMSGSCMTAGQTCYVTPPSGKMSCWDGSFVDTYSSCPSTPTTKSDCETKGNKWCDSSTVSTYSTYSSGWCTGKTQNCPAYPPVGKMTCPDGVTFATTLTECPTAGTTLISPTLKTCPDGSIVDKSWVCPVVLIICSDGTKLRDSTDCPVKTDDSVSVCLNKKGVWCLDKAGGSGYCALEGRCKTDLPDEKEVLDAKQIKLIESMKKDYARNLDTLEKTFKRLEDTESLAKIAALKEKLASLPSDTSVFDALEAMKDDIMTLREVKDDLISKKGEIEMSERDLEMQAKALKQMKKNMLAFEKQLKKMDTKAAALKKQGFSLPSALEDILTQGKVLMGKIKASTNFEEARDAGESLAELSEDLNLWAINIDQLVKISSVLRNINGQITNRESALKSVKALATRLKVDLQANLDDVSATLASVREAYGQLKTRAWGEEEPFEFVQSAIIDKLENADNDMANIRALANLKASVNKIATQIKNFDTRIARLVKQKKDVAELASLVDQLKEVHGELKALAGEKLANLDLDNVLEKLGAANSLMEEINDLLKISAPSILERQLKQNFKVEKINVPEVEKEVIRAYRVATFFRRAPAQMAEYVSSIKEAGVNTINRWRNRLAID